MDDEWFPFEFERDALSYDPFAGFVGAPPPQGQPPTLDQTLAQLQHWGQTLGQGLSDWPAQVATPIVAPIAQKKIDAVGDKAMAAADTVQAQAADVGTQAKRTLAVAQAQMLAASRDIKETSQHTRATADVAKYVLLGVGGLAAAALLITIIKQAT